MEQVIVPAYAKINLALDVLYRRDDGFHEVEMVMQTVALKDRVKMILTSEGIEVWANRGDVPSGKENLAYRAAELLAGLLPHPPGVKIILEKNIPIAAGLAGGSSDAAAVLLGLNVLWEMELPIAELLTIGGKLGSDVPFCLIGGTALAQGRGERISILPKGPSLWLVLVKPPFGVSTAEVYQHFSLGSSGDRPDVGGMVQAIESSDENRLLAAMGNALERVTLSRYPMVREIKEELLVRGARKALMCGSGPTVLGVVKDREQAENLALQMREKYTDVFVTCTI
ncbi:MAG: 4-(cytidine 5'-diphospho)-2-C-methyl-D-erythritol kinase [Bacillota bacterium]